MVNVWFDTDDYGEKYLLSIAPHQIKTPYLTVPIRTSGAPCGQQATAGIKSGAACKPLRYVCKRPTFCGVWGERKPDTDEYGKVRRKVLVRFAVNHDCAAICFEPYRGVFRHGCEAVAAERAVRMRANFCSIRSKSRRDERCNAGMATV